MPAQAAALASVESPALRRFQLPDLGRHGGWMMKRLLLAYPHLNDRHLQGWLKGLVYSNEFMFLYQNHSVALAQRVHTHTLAPKPIIQERFVFAEDPKNPAHIAEAAEFYDHFARWAKQQGIDTILVEEMSDVPHEDVKKVKSMGRLFERKQIYARIGGKEG